VIQSILARDPERFRPLTISSYRWPDSEVRYRTARNFCSTSSSHAVRLARFRIGREHRCQSPSRCCRILVDCQCCSRKRDRRETRSALSLWGLSSAQSFAERFGAAAPRNRRPRSRKSNGEPDTARAAFMQIDGGKAE